MLRLNLSAAPRWVDLGHGVRLELRPATSSVITQARHDPEVRALVPEAARVRDEAAGVEAEGAGVEDEAALDPALRDTLALAIAKAVARRCVIGWEGVGDDEGQPIASPSPEGIEALLEVPALFEAFQARFLAPAMLLVTEKNDSAPAPTGTSAAARNTARPARDGA